jgi:hypothetical protein
VVNNLTELSLCPKVLWKANLKVMNSDIGEINLFAARVQGVKWFVLTAYNKI